MSNERVQMLHAYVCVCVMPSVQAELDQLAIPHLEEMSNERVRAGAFGLPSQAAPV